MDGVRDDDGVFDGVCDADAVFERVLDGEGVCCGARIAEDIVDMRIIVHGPACGRCGAWAANVPI